MKTLMFFCRTAIDDFRRNRMRTFLTSLGILIGVMSVILLMALGLGLKEYINGQFESLGSNLVYVMPGSKNAMMKGGGMIGGIKFDDKDVKEIENLDITTAIAPLIAKIGTIVEGNNESEICDVLGSTEQIVDVFNLEISSGRMIEKKDIQKKNKVALISVRLADKLYKSENEALDKDLDISGQKFRIIGIIKSKGSGGLGSDLDSHVYVPLKSMSSLTEEKKYYAIYAKLTSKDNIEKDKEVIKEALNDRYDEDDFSVLDQADIMSTVSTIFGVINMVLVAIAAISLLVGGIGVMNIMYVSVTERTKEIGVRRAFGAQKKDILLHFLTESVLLAMMGGILGLTLSYLIVSVVKPFFPAYIDFLSVVLALGVSSIIGIIFGVVPAKRAAELEPVEAMRYE